MFPDDLERRSDEAEEFELGACHVHCVRVVDEHQHPCQNHDDSCQPKPRRSVSALSSAPDRKQCLPPAGPGPEPSAPNSKSGRHSSPIKAYCVRAVDEDEYPCRNHDDPCQHGRQHLSATSPRHQGSAPCTINPKLEIRAPLQPHETRCELRAAPAPIRSAAARQGPGLRNLRGVERVGIERGSRRGGHGKAPCVWGKGAPGV